MVTYRRDGRRHLKKRADNRYRLIHNGKPIYGYTEDEVYDQLAEIERQEEEGRLRKDNPTVAEYGNKWLPIAKASVSTAVYDDYARQLTKLYKYSGEEKIRNIKPTDIKAAYAQLVGMSQSSIRHARLIWTGLFDAAVADGYLRMNPVRDKTAQPHKGTSGSHRSITAEERRLILETEHPLRPLVILMLYAGLRRGEALAINVDEDVDFEAKTITVNKAVRYVGNRPVLADPKTEAGRRTIPMLPILEEVMKGRHGLVYGRLVEGKWEYATETGFTRAWEAYNNTLCRAANNGLQKRWYGRTQEHKAIIKSGGQLPPYNEIRIRPHDLRHSYCTMLRDAGVDMHVAMEWLGHADEKMILKIYDHTENRIRASVDKVTIYISQDKTGAKKGSGRKIYRIHKAV